MDETVRYAVVDVPETKTWEFVAMTRVEGGFWYPACSEEDACRRCPFRGGGCSPLMGSMSFRSREEAVFYAATIGVEVWGANPEAGWLLSDGDMRRLS